MEVELRNAKQAEDFLKKFNEDTYYFIAFYRSDCGHTAPTKEALQDLKKTLQAEGVVWVVAMDQAIHVIRRFFGISAQEMSTVPAIIVAHGRNSWRFFFARQMQYPVQEAHFRNIQEQLEARQERRGGSDKQQRKDKKEGPVFFTYYFHRSMRHDPVHTTIVGALILLRSLRHTPTNFRPVTDLNMHGVLTVNGGINRTYQGHAAASYLSRLVEANEKFGLFNSSTSQERGERRGGGERKGATWADYLTGFTITAALLAGL